MYVVDAVYESGAESMTKGKSRWDFPFGMRGGKNYILEMMSTISAPMRFCASTVAAPMCGVQETIGWE